jgi:hypothetical protein
MIPLALICAALLLALAFQQRSFNTERRDWTKERQLLITKIQHPEFIISTPEAPVVPDSDLLREEPDEIDRVGEILGEISGD